MNKWKMDILCCPKCNRKLIDKDGCLKCTNCAKEFPVIKSVPRFVSQENNYCENFGWEWNRFCRTQIDDFSGIRESERRFRQETGWNSKQIAGDTLIDCGCGSGRFSDIALKSGAKLIALDISSSVEACYENLIRLGHDPNNFLIVQASLYAFPIRRRSVDRAFCIGVIHHTPNRRKAVEEICSRVRPGGKVAFWVYEKSLRNYIGYKYYFRMLTCRLSLEQNWRLTKGLVSTFFPIAWIFNKSPGIGKILNRVLMPIAFRNPAGSSYSQAMERSLLDTFDNLSPLFDRPISERNLRKWMAAVGVFNIERLPSKGLAMAGTII